MFSFLEGCGLALALLLPKLVLFVGNPTWLPLVDGFSPLNAIRQWGSSQSQVAWIEGLYKSVVLLCKIHFFEQKITKASQFHTSPFLPGISAPIVGLWVDSSGLSALTTRIHAPTLLRRLDLGVDRRQTGALLGVLRLRSPLYMPMKLQQVYIYIYLFMNKWIIWI